ncbi:MAG: hypothetical protein ACKO5E_07370, partial [bacterium]
MLKARNKLANIANERKREEGVAFQDIILSPDDADVVSDKLALKHNLFYRMQAILIWPGPLNSHSAQKKAGSLCFCEPAPFFKL